VEGVVGAEAKAVAAVVTQVAAVAAECRKAI